MATIVSKVTSGFTLDPGWNWNYWFYANNGSFQSTSTVDKDLSSIHALARPWLNNSWDIDGDEMTVLLEADSSVPPKYRHVYVLNVKNNAVAKSGDDGKRKFFIVTSELKP